MNKICTFLICRSLFGSNDPSKDSSESEDCLVSLQDSIFPLRFLDYPCTQKALGVVCEKPLEVYIAPCPVNYTRYFDKCFKPEYDKTNLEGAMTQCSDQDALLAYPETADEIVSEIRRDFLIEIDLKLSFQELLKALVEDTSVLLGGKLDEKDKNFQGPDGGQMSKNWLPGHPLEKKECAAIEIEGFKHGLVSKDCKKKTEAFACQRAS